MTHPTWAPLPSCEFGSLEIVGPRYRAVQLRGPVFGPTYYRQLRANALGAVCYVEAHYNASVVAGVNYAECILGPDRAAARLGDAFLSLLSARANIRSTGCRVGPGSGNVARVRAPAMLIEPGFVSNPKWAAYVRSSEGCDLVAFCLAEAIKGCYPGGGLVALSVGHAYRRSAHAVDWSDEEKRGDGGAPVVHGGAEEGWREDPAFNEEAELAEMLVMSTGEWLAGYAL